MFEQLQCVGTDYREQTRILLLEDNPTDAHLVRMELHGDPALHAEVVTTERLADALELVVDNDYDLVLVDLDLPDSSGAATVECLRQHVPHLPIIVLTGQCNEQLATEVLRRGVQDYLLKGQLSGQLFSKAIRDAIERHHFAAALDRYAHELEASEARVRTIIEANTDAMVIVDTSGMVRFANPSAGQMFGRRVDALTGHPFGFPVISGQSSEVDILRPDGSAGVAEMRVVPIRWGREQAVLASLRDITEQKRAAEALRESERRFSSILGNVQSASLMLDQNGRIVYCNDYFLTLTGWEREEVIGQNWFKVFVPPEASESQDAFSTLLAEKAESWNHKSEILTRQRQRRLIRWTNCVLRSVSGEIIGSASIGEDITEQHHAEQKIRRLNRVYAVLSRINNLIVRVRDRKELFQESCRIAVQAGGFRLAWIGTINRATTRIELVAWEGGSRNFIQILQSELEEQPLSRFALLRHALDQRKAQVAMDLTGDSRVVLKQESLELGLRAMVTLPLIVSGKVIGVICLYAPEPDFFDGNEMQLLSELAGDVSFALDHIEKENRLDYLASYDDATGLPNRVLLRDRLSQAAHFADRGELRAAILFIDLDRFKLVNDTLGHAVGDEVLRVTARRISKCVRKMDTVARLGGDEFVAVLAGNPSSELRPDQVAQRILDSFAEPIIVGEQELFITCSIGIARYPGDGSDADTLLRHADAAMYRAKKEGGNNFQGYAAAHGEAARDRLSMETALRHAIRRDQLVLLYQPKIDLRSGQMLGVEALVRWRHPELGLVPPNRFIPIAEETGLILPIGEWVLQTACAQGRAWRKLKTAVNLSAVQFRQRDLTQIIARVVRETGFDPESLEIELTEGMLIQNVESAIRTMAELKRLGVGVSLDDFGTGYSSLSYLNRFPVDTVKIDQSFVREITSDPGSAAISNAIIAMAHSLRLKVVAEGVETDGQLAALRARGCDQMQGYLFSKPLSAEDLLQLVRDDPRLPAAMVDTMGVST